MAPRSFEAVCFCDWRSRSWGNADYAEFCGFCGLLLAPTTLFYRSKQLFSCARRVLDAGSLRVNPLHPRNPRSPMNVNV